MPFALLNASLPSAVPLVSVNSKHSWIGATLQARVWKQVQHSDRWVAAARLYSRRPKPFLNLASAPSTMPTNCASRKSVSANTTTVENALFHPSSKAKLSASGYLDQQCGNQLSASEKSLRGPTMSELAKQLFVAIEKTSGVQSRLHRWIRIWPRYLHSLRRKKLRLRPSRRLRSQNTQRHNPHCHQAHLRHKLWSQSTYRKCRRHPRSGHLRSSAGLPRI